MWIGAAGAKDPGLSDDKGETARAGDATCPAARLLLLARTGDPPQAPS